MSRIIISTIVRINYLVVSTLLCTAFSAFASETQPELSQREVTLLTVGGLQFKDLNHSGKLEPFEDWRLTAEERSTDLVKRMTLEEKAGVMMHGSAPTADSPIGAGTHYDMAAAEKMISGAKVNSLITRLSAEDPAVMAEENNKLQQIAEKTRLGIPVTISSDPRNSFEYLIGASTSSGKHCAESRSGSRKPVCTTPSGRYRSSAPEREYEAPWFSGSG